MKKFAIWLMPLVCFILFSGQLNSVHGECKAQRNNRPIIGILSQEISYKLNQIYPGRYRSFIAASYVKFVESAGARVVPIWIGKNESYYNDVMSKINGVLFPGGSTWFNNTEGYADAGNIIYKIASRYNAKKDFFPIFGICLGFELLTYLAAHRVEHRVSCSSHNQPLPLEFKPDYKSSKLFKHAPTAIIDILKKENVTGNYHQYCVTEKGLEKVKVLDDFRVISTNHDLNNHKFVSAIEHKHYPFYGLQFHPEKNMFEWIEGKNIPHSRNAVRSSTYFADFFVNEARKSHHFFSDSDEELNSVIYNYQLTYTGAKKSIYEQCYLFE